MKKIKRLVKTSSLINILLYSCLSYSNSPLSLDCYTQFSNLGKSVLQLPEDPVKRHFLWQQIQLEPDKYAEQLKLPKNKEIREAFFKFVEKHKEIPYVSEIFATFERKINHETIETFFKFIEENKEILDSEIFTAFEHKTNNKISERVIKQLGISLAPRKPNRPPYYKAYIMPGPEPKSHLKLVSSQPEKLTEEQILANADKTEDKIISLLETIQKKSNKQNSEELKKMKAKLHEIKETISNFSQSPKTWETYNSQIKSIEQRLYILNIRDQVKTLEKLLIHPDFLLANHTYSVKFQNKETYYIEFNEKVTASLAKLSPKQIKLILKNIKKGFVGGTKQTGLKILNQNNSRNSRYKNSIIEIKTMGSEVGHIRIGGSIEEHNIKFVRFTSESDHSKSASKKHFKENIYQFSLKNN